MEAFMQCDKIWGLEAPSHCTMILLLPDYVYAIVRNEV